MGKANFDLELSIIRDGANRDPDPERPGAALLSAFVDRVDAYLGACEADPDFDPFAELHPWTSAEWADALFLAEFLRGTYPRPETPIGARFASDALVADTTPVTQRSRADHG